MNVIIIGNGIAGNRVADTLRKDNKDIAITIISQEGFPEYNPCSLPYFAAGDVTRELVFRKTIADYKKDDINLILNEKIVQLDTVCRQLVSDSGIRYSYDYLVLAYGADPKIPPIKGVGKPGVFTCTRLSEFEKLRDAASGPVVVLGSGAVGIEVAEALRKQEKEVSLVEIFDWILPGLFDREPAALLENNLLHHQINVFTGEKVSQIEGDNYPTGVVTNHRIIPCRSVVIAAGIAPDISWLSGTGIRVNQGILVDEFMQTSVPAIYACGDCAETIDAVSGDQGIFALKHNALDQAGITARNILGEKIKYNGSSTIVRVSFFNSHSVSIGSTSQKLKAKANLETIEKQTDEGYLKIIMIEGYVKGFQAIGRFAGYSGFFLDFMRRNENIKELRKTYRGKYLTASSHRWLYHKIGFLLGFNLEKNFPGADNEN